MRSLGRNSERKLAKIFKRYPGRNWWRNLKQNNKRKISWRYCSRNLRRHPVKGSGNNTGKISGTISGRNSCGRFVKVSWRNSSRKPKNNFYRNTVWVTGKNFWGNSFREELWKTIKKESRNQKKFCYNIWKLFGETPAEMRVKSWQIFHENFLR